MRAFATLLEAELEALAAIDRRRACPEAAGNSRVQPDVRGAPMLSFCSNDYLGLASHPALAAAAAEAAARDGFGASASRLVAGDLPAHRALEAALAAFLDRPAALVFPSGYQTNVGVLTALAGRDDLIVSDALNHASLVDGCRLSRARVAVYPHADARAAAPAAGRRDPVPPAHPGDGVAVQHGRRRGPARRAGRCRRRDRQHPGRGRSACVRRPRSRGPRPVRRRARRARRPDRDPGQGGRGGRRVRRRRGAAARPARQPRPHVHLHDRAAAPCRRRGRRRGRADRRAPRASAGAPAWRSASGRSARRWSGAASSAGHRTDRSCPSSWAARPAPWPWPRRSPRAASSSRPSAPRPCRPGSSRLRITLSAAHEPGDVDRLAAALGELLT